MQSDFSVQASEITLLKANEKRILRDISDFRERTKSLEEELHKVKAARSVDDLQRKELEDQLEAEQYFSTLYKTQVKELQVISFTIGELTSFLYSFFVVCNVGEYEMLFAFHWLGSLFQDEVDESKERLVELDQDLESVRMQLNQATTRVDSEALARRVAEEDIAELEKEKMMIELELKDIGSKHKADARNLEMQLATLKDTVIKKTFLWKNETWKKCLPLNQSLFFF